MTGRCRGQSTSSGTQLRNENTTTHATLATRTHNTSNAHTQYTQPRSQWRGTVDGHKHERRRTSVAGAALIARVARAVARAAVADAGVGALRVAVSRVVEVGNISPRELVRARTCRSHDQRTATPNPFEKNGLGRQSGGPAHTTSTARWRMRTRTISHRPARVRGQRSGRTDVDPRGAWTYAASSRGQSTQAQPCRSRPSCRPCA
jgi:hypothetical protein